MFFDYTGGANLSTAQNVTTSAASTNVFDVTGAGVGSAPAMIGAGGLNTAMGIDIGAGDGAAMPEVVFVVTTTGTGTGTVAFGIEAAPDSGTYTEGSYTRLATSAAFVGTALTAGMEVKIPVPPIPSTFSGLPRFYRAYYDQTGNGAVHVTANLLLNAPDLVDPKKYGSNFVVAA